MRLCGQVIGGVLGVAALATMPTNPYALALATGQIVFVCIHLFDHIRYPLAVRMMAQTFIVVAMANYGGADEIVTGVYRGLFVLFGLAATMLFGNLVFPYRATVAFRQGGGQHDRGPHAVCRRPGRAPCLRGPSVSGRSARGSAHAGLLLLTRDHRRQTTGALPPKAWNAEALGILLVDIPFEMTLGTRAKPDVRLYGQVRSRMRNLKVRPRLGRCAWTRGA